MTRNSLQLGTKYLKISGPLPSRPSFLRPLCSFKVGIFKKKPSEIHPHDLDESVVALDIFCCFLKHVVKHPFEGFQTTRDSKTTGPPDVCQAAGMPHVHLAFIAKMRGAGFLQIQRFDEINDKGNLGF